MTTEASTLTIATEGFSDVAVGAYVGSDLASLTLLGCRLPYSDSPLRVPLAAGQTVFLQVGGSLYDETKHQAHLVAERAIAEGLPVVIVMPSAVYGPGDKSPIRLPLDLFLQVVGAQAEAALAASLGAL